MSARRIQICGPGETFYVNENSSDDDSDSDSCGGDVSSSGSDGEGDESAPDEDDDIGTGNEENEEVKGVEQVDDQTIKIVDKSDVEMQHAVSGGWSEGGEDETSRDALGGKKGEKQQVVGDEVAQVRRSGRKSNPPPPFHENAFDKLTDDESSPPSSDDDDDGSSVEDEDLRKKKEEEKRRREFTRKKAEKEEERDTEYGDSVEVSKNVKGKRKLEDNNNNGKLIKPPLPGSEHIAPCYSGVYLQQAQSGHWYIGHSTQPWVRIREHNGHLRAESASNLGEHTGDPNKRPWRQRFLIEGFENAIVAQGFESQWRAKHPDIEDDSISHVSHFIHSLNQLLHEASWQRTLLDIRVFDADSAESWWNQGTWGANYFRHASLRFIDDIHVDIPGWDRDIKHPDFKKHKLQVLRRRMRNYKLYREYFNRGRRVITQSNIEHKCTICNQVIRENDGKGKLVFEYGMDRPITGTSLMVLCPATGCKAVSHMTCLANAFYRGEKATRADVDYSNITLPVPISGDCRLCTESGTWKDIRREIQWRLKADPVLWRRIWRRRELDLKETRSQDAKYQNDLRKAKKDGLEAPTPPSPPEISNEGPRLDFWMNGEQLQTLEFTANDRRISAAIQDMVLGQTITGNVNKLTWFEKILLGDIICIDRFHQWIISHIDNQELISRVEGIRNDDNGWAITMRDVTNFLDASSVSWANYENSRELPKYQASARKDRLRATLPGKCIFKYNDTAWMFNDDKAKRRSLGVAVSEVEIWRTAPEFAKILATKRLEKLAKRRRRRIALEEYTRPIYKSKRDLENNDECIRHLEIRMAKIELKRLWQIAKVLNPPRNICRLVPRQVRIIRRLEAGDEPRRNIMEERKLLAADRELVRVIDKRHAEQRREMRRDQRLRRRYNLASTPGVESTERHSLVQRRRPKDRVRTKLPRIGKEIGLDGNNELPERATRSGKLRGSSLSSLSDAHKNAAAGVESNTTLPELIHEAIMDSLELPQPENLDEEMDIDIYNYVEPDSPSSSTSSDQDVDQHIFSSQESVASSTTSDEAEEMDIDTPGYVEPDSLSSPASSDGDVGQHIFSWQESVMNSITSGEGHPAPATRLRFKATRKQKEKEKVASLLARLSISTKGMTPKRGLVPPPYVPRPLYFVPPLVPNPIRVEEIRAKDEKRYLHRWFEPERKRGRPGFEGEFAWLKKRKQ